MKQDWIRRCSNDTRGGCCCLIAGIPVVMMLAATALWWTVEAGYLNVVDRFGTANHGALDTHHDLLARSSFVTRVLRRFSGVISR